MTNFVDSLGRLALVVLWGPFGCLGLLLVPLARSWAPFGAPLGSHWPVLLVALAASGKIEQPNLDKSC